MLIVLQPAFFYNYRDAFKPQWESYGVLEERFTNWKRRSLLDCGIATPLPDDWESLLLQMIPDRQICDVLILRFLHTFNATHTVIDGEVFQAEVDNFFEHKQASSPMWLALLAAVLAMGWQLPVIPLPAGTSTDRGKAHGARLMAFVQSLAFASSKWARRPSLLRFQLLLILIMSDYLSFDWVDGSDVISGLLGLTTRMAFTMGLHRDPKYAKRYSEPEMELRRTVNTSLTITTGHNLLTTFVRSCGER